MKLRTQVLATVAMGGMLVAPAVGIAGQGSVSANRTHSVVDDALLNRAAAAFLEVDQFVRDGNEEIAATNDTGKRRQIADATEQAVTQAVKENGLRPVQYNQIMGLVMSDRALEQKFISDLDQVQATYD